jgi:hypothetical protein
MADFKAVILGVRKVLGILTDFLLVGRNRGLWSKKKGELFYINDDEALKKLKDRR